MRAKPQQLSESQFNDVLMKLIAMSRAGQFGYDDFGRGPQVWPPRGKGMWELRWGPPIGTVAAKFGNAEALRRTQ